MRYLVGRLAWALFILLGTTFITFAIVFLVPGDPARVVAGPRADAQTIAGNAKGATQDLGALRTDVETNLRKIEQMVNELNRKWPFAREVEIKLP